MRNVAPAFEHSCYHDHLHRGADSRPQRREAELHAGGAEIWRLLSSVRQRRQNLLINKRSEEKPLR